MREHALHLYPDDARLATTVAVFLAPAFAEGQAILTIGTRAHVAAIEQRLRTEGHDVDGARRRGQYLSLDAERLIPRLLRDGLPTAETFDEVVGRHVTRLAGNHGGVRAFGETAALLWRDGKRAAGLRLEDLWNDSLGDLPLALVCGYAERVLDGKEIGRIAKLHTHRIEREDVEFGLQQIRPEVAHQAVDGAAG